MAIVSSHILNATDGTHAAGVALRLINLASGAVIAESISDSGGRVMLDIDLSQADPSDQYELVFLPRKYFEESGHDLAYGLDEIVLRFYVPDPNARYHMPVILSPHGYSIWKSAPEPIA